MRTDDVRRTSLPACNGVWLFDVDGTLIGSIRSNVLRPGADQLFSVLHNQGKTIIVWSAGGADYARRMLAQFDLHHLVTAFYDKAARDKHGRYRTDHLADEHQPGILVDDVPGDMPEPEKVLAVSQFMGSNPHDIGFRDILVQLKSSS